MSDSVVTETSRMIKRRLYIDSNVFIYAIETQHDVANQVRQIFSLLNDRVATGVTTELSLAEVNVHASAPQRRLYLELMVFSGLIDLRPVTRQILYDTTVYRRQFAREDADGQIRMPKLLDAIHVVTAVDAACGKLVSFDRRIRLPENIPGVGREDDGLIRLLEDLRHV